MALSPVRVRSWQPAEAEKIRAQIEVLRPWYYSFDFGDGLTTRQGQYPVAKFEKVLTWLPTNLNGASCLDCPSNNAQLSMLLEDRGAGAVVARDIDPIAIRQGEYLNELLGYHINLGVRDVYSLISDTDCAGGFDFVFCLGLLYHLRDMVGAMRVLATLTKQECFLETEVLRIEDYDPNTALFIEGRYASDETNWWIPGVQCVIGMGRSAGFSTVELMDYYEPRNMKVTREGYRYQARGIFRATKGAPLVAQRLVMQE